jgi:hypothetical protein
MSLILFSQFIIFKDYEPTNFHQSILLLSQPYSMRYRKSYTFAREIICENFSTISPENFNQIGCFVIKDIFSHFAVRPNENYLFNLIHHHPERVHLTYLIKIDLLSQKDFLIY